jgi:hypothetical protein
VNNNLYVDPNLSIGDDQSSYIWDSNSDLKSFTQISDNVWGTPGSTNSWMNGGLFDVGDGQTTQAAWQTPAEWEAQKLANGGTPTGDVYENVTLGTTNSVKANGTTAGSDLPNT